MLLERANALVTRGQMPYSDNNPSMDDMKMYFSSSAIWSHESLRNTILKDRKIFDKKKIQNIYLERTEWNFRNQNEVVVVFKYMASTKPIQMQLKLLMICIPCAISTDELNSDLKTNGSIKV